MDGVAGMSDGLRLHPRTMKVQSASADIRMKLIEMQREHGLTDTEMIGVLMETGQAIVKYALRWERHQDYDHKADEA